MRSGGRIGGDATGMSAQVREGSWRGRSGMGTEGLKLWEKKQSEITKAEAWLVEIKKRKGTRDGG